MRAVATWRLRDDGFRRAAAKVSRRGGTDPEGLADRAGLSAYGIQRLECRTTRPYRDGGGAGTLGPGADELQAGGDRVRRRGTPRREAPGARSPRCQPRAEDGGPGGGGVSTTRKQRPGDQLTQH